MTEVATVETLTAAQLAALEKVADRTDSVLAEARSAMSHLRDLVDKLESAHTAKAECLEDLEFWVDDVDGAIDDLIELIEEKRA